MLIDLEPPPLEPISLSEAKAFLRVDHDEENDLIETLIRSARERLEVSLNLAMIQRPMRQDAQAPGDIALRRWPVVSVDHVRINDVVTDDFSADLHCRPAAVTARQTGRISIDFTAGYGTEANAVPAPLRQALLLLISRGFEHRDEEPENMPLMVDALTMPYRGIGL